MYFQAVNAEVVPLELKDRIIIKIYRAFESLKDGL